jgi:hypothetical protein
MQKTNNNSAIDSTDSETSYRVIIIQMSEQAKNIKDI